MASPLTERHTAELVIVGFEGETVSAELRRLIERAPPAGVILFKRNISSVAQVAALTRELRGLWPKDAPTPFIAVDQEGGPVRRLKAPDCPEVLETPAMRVLGRLDDAALTAEVGELMARQLAALGFNLNFAPVLDVDSNPNNPVIGERSFSSDPEAVIRHGLALAEGLERGGVIPCGKHFPGHGDTLLDSHHALPALAHDLERLRALELKPFAAAARAKLPMIMTAHVLFGALDAERPATLSPRVLGDLLRGELGYEGVIVSDDLEMRAVADRYDARALAALGLAAGLDLFLVCHTASLAEGIALTLAELAADDPEAAARIERSRARVMSLRRRASDPLGRPFVGIVPGHERAEILAQRWLGGPSRG